MEFLFWPFRVKLHQVVTGQRSLERYHNERHKKSHRQFDCLSLVFIVATEADAGLPAEVRIAIATVPVHVVMLVDGLGGHQAAVLRWLVCHLLVHEPVGTWVKEAKEEVDLWISLMMARQSNWNNQLNSRTCIQAIQAKQIYSP